MKCQLGKLMNLPTEVETLQRQIDHLKVNQKPEVNENVPQKPKFPYLEKARSRLPSTASNTSKRARTEDETDNDFVKSSPNLSQENLSILVQNQISFGLKTEIKMKKIYYMILLGVLVMFFTQPQLRDQTLDHHIPIDINHLILMDLR